MPISRRAVLKGLGASGAASLLRSSSVRAADAPHASRAGRSSSRSRPSATTSSGSAWCRSRRASRRRSRRPGRWSKDSPSPLSCASPSFPSRRSVSCGRRRRQPVCPARSSIRVERADGSIVQDLKIDEATGGFSFRLGDGPVLGLGEGGPPVRSSRLGRPDAQRPGRIQPAHPRRPRARALADRHGGWAMFVHQPGGTFDLTADRGRVRTDCARRRASARHLHRDRARAGAHHGRVCALDRSSRNAAALVARLSAVAPHARQPRSGAFDRANISREEAPLRRAHLSGDRLLSVGLEHRPRLVRVQPDGFPRPQADARRAAQACISTWCRMSSSAPDR